MADIFERLGRVLASWVEDAGLGPTGRKPEFGDEDLNRAWSELDAFLSTGETPKDGARHQPPRPPESAREILRRDYHNLEVPFGAPMADVQASYRRLMRKYHPDRHAGDPEKQRLANELTGGLNVSFNRIRRFEENRR